MTKEALEIKHEFIQCGSVVFDKLTCTTKVIRVSVATLADREYELISARFHRVTVS